MSKAKTPKDACANQKSLFFFEIKDVILLKWQCEGRTVNQAYYLESGLVK